MSAAFSTSLVLAAALLAAQPSFKSAVDVVRVDASVTRSGVPVTGLGPADFLVTDDGMPVRVETATLMTTPLSVVIALDVSGSVEGDALAQLVRAVRGVIGALRDGDRAALLSFSERVSLDVPLTTDPRAFDAALTGIRAGGTTSLRDALQAALLTAPADESRPLVLLFSDGRDTASWLSEDRALEAARRSSIVVHAIRLRRDVGPLPKDLKGLLPLDAQRSADFIDRVAVASGGRSWPAGSFSDLADVFVRALNEMRARYLLSFTRNPAARDGWHPLAVRVRARGARVVARPGYFVTAAR